MLPAKKIPGMACLTFIRPREEMEACVMFTRLCAFSFTASGLCEIRLATQASFNLTLKGFRYDSLHYEDLKRQLTLKIKHAYLSSGL